MRSQRHFCDSPIPNTEPESNHKEASDRTKPRDMLQNSWLLIFKSAKVMKVKGRLKNCSRLKETGHLKVQMSPP